MANTYPEGSGGGDDSTTDDTTTDDGSTDDGGSDGDGDSGGSTDLRPWAVFSALAAIFPFLDDLRDYADGKVTVNDLENWIVENVIIDWIASEIVEPIVGAFLSVIELLVEAVLTVFFGQDLVFGGDSYGVADLLVAGGATFAGVVEAILNPVIQQATAFNASVAQLAASGGPLAPALVAGLWMAEVAVVLYLVWGLARVFNLPVINLDGILAVLWLPVDRLLGVFQS